MVTSVLYFNKFVVVAIEASVENIAPVLLEREKVEGDKRIYDLQVLRIIPSGNHVSGRVRTTLSNCA